MTLQPCAETYVERAMKALLVYAKFPMTYWGFQYALPIAGAAASLPPLGLITLAAELPPSWELRLCDTNVEPLRDQELAWADVVLVSGMLLQRPSVLDILARARRAGCKTAVGGPVASVHPEELRDAHVVFVGEAEGRIDELCGALAAADDEQPTATLRPGSRPRPSLRELPVPRFDLLALANYPSMSVQFSRGCPFSCEFCDVVELFGHSPRTKPPEQLVAELEALRRLGYRGTVFVVDDNFIGHRQAVRELLAALERWQQAHGHPFGLYTEASVNLAADPDLLAAMVRAGFVAVFLGIETPSRAALEEAGKTQNMRLDLGDAVRTITATGIEVMGGFIVGFDHDDPSVFDVQREFISAMPIPLAMVGILCALPNTALWRRLEREGRLRVEVSGDQFDRPNFVPRMAERALLEGYARLLASLYSADAYYDRCRRYVDLSRRARHSRGVAGARELATLGRAIWSIGIRSARRRQFWGLLAHSVLTAPHTLSWCVASAIQGEHLVRYTAEDVLPRLRAILAGLALGGVGLEGAAEAGRPCPTPVVAPAAKRGQAPLAA